MEIVILKPRKAINKAFLKIKPNRTEIESFKTNLIQLLDRINDMESEEFHKNLVSDFLKKTYFEPNHFINTKGRNDLVIHNGNKAKSTVGVIIEAKKPTNKAEMLTKNRINVKAFQELVLYYLRERITHKNLEIKYLVATNINEWFIFDSNVFEKQFAQNKGLVKQFNDFENGRLAGKTTDFFYKEIAEPFINDLKQVVEFTFFDIREYEKPLRNDNPKDDNKLIALFKLLSPENLLKLPFANDSNSLNKRFYGELLHIIGLSETKDGGKKLIERNKKGERNTGSFLENAIIQLDILDKINRLDNPSHFGTSQDERLFNVGLELSITWINRVLFLKLLEAQLKTYHKGDKSYEFLNIDKIQNYDDLNSLFFQVLAKKQTERNEDIQKLFSKVPYLNSSLFEPTGIEHGTLFISNLRDEKTLPLYSATVLRNGKGKKRTGNLSTLEYLFEFLNAYDFSSEGSEEIQEDNKTLINASVLGLIFEKINGYKDGSFFTPGFITMYMCHETTRRAVVQKFNETKDWNCIDIDSLYDKIEDRQEANDIINSLKICDPAVGSGHFLVSALNEIIAIKNDLKILQDRDGKRLKEYQVEVVNDELIITDEDDELFEYSPTNKESQRIQEALFHEKQTIIENCLFGVDINPNSVKICRLRLWIELLKNAYYKNESELETLPNIDINIKSGNTLISRFVLDSDLKKALKNSKWTIDSYRIAVDTYRNAQNKEQKRQMEKLIDAIKSDFKSNIDNPFKKKISKARARVDKLSTEINTKKQWQEKISKILFKDLYKASQNLKKLEEERDSIEANVIYQEAFEWRFEFPEVLDDNGDFVGFDIVIGNPPYIRQEEYKDIKPYLKTRFETFISTSDLFVFFIELGLKIIKDNGNFVYIVPNKWMKAGYGVNLRNYLTNFHVNSILDFGDLPVFEEASTYPSILSITKKQSAETFDSALFSSLNFPIGLQDTFQKSKFQVETKYLSDNGWTLIDSKAQKILGKIKNQGSPLSEIVSSYRGILTGLNEAFLINSEKKEELINLDKSNKEIIKPFLGGKEIKKYTIPIEKQYLILFKNGITKEWFGEITEKEAWDKLNGRFPYICNHLKAFEKKAKKRTDQGQFWWELRACDYYNEFENDKLVWPETSFNNQFCIVEKGYYLNKTAFFIPRLDYALLGILNSSLIRFYLDSIVSKMRGGYFSLSKAYVETIPIAKNYGNNQQIMNLVNEIYERRLNCSNSDTTIIENQIDQLVYAMYGLTDEEIKVVEGATT